MSDLVERLQSHMGLADMQEVLADCRLAASRISQQDAELERMRRELDDIREKLKDPAAVRINYLRGDIACQPIIDETRKAAFIEAAEIVLARARDLRNGDAYRFAASHIASDLRAKAEETRT